MYVVYEPGGPAGWLVSSRACATLPLPAVQTQSHRSASLSIPLAEWPVVGPVRCCSPSVRPWAANPALERASSTQEAGSTRRTPGAMFRRRQPGVSSATSTAGCLSPPRFGSSRPALPHVPHLAGSSVNPGPNFRLQPYLATRDEPTTVAYKLEVPFAPGWLRTGPHRSEHVLHMTRRDEDTCTYMLCYACMHAFVMPL